MIETNLVNTTPSAATSPDDNCSQPLQAGGTADESAPQANNLLHRTIAVFDRYIYLPEREDYTLLAVWTIGTHLHKSFDYFGYLLLDSPDRECGKTLVLSVLDKLVWNSSNILTSPTEATMFRLNRFTQLLDEGDGWRDTMQLYNILNVGFQAGMKVPRCVEKQGDYLPKKYDAYIPRAVAGINLTEKFPATIVSRSFLVTMERQKLEERREKFRLRKASGELAALHAEIEAWANANQKPVEAAIDSWQGNPLPLLRNLRDRTRDIAEPLFAILQVLSPDDQLVLLKAVEHTRSEDDNLSDGLAIIKDLYELGDDPVVGMASELAERIGRQGVFDEGPKHISSTLRAFRFQKKSVRLPGGDPRSRYVLPRADLGALIARYDSQGNQCVVDAAPLADYEQASDSTRG